MNKQRSLNNAESNIAKHLYVKLWRQFASEHVNDAGMAGAEMEILTNAEFLDEASHPIVNRIREIACNHQLIEGWML
jgi:hypothetical protein